MFEQDIRLGPGTGTTTSHTLEILIMLFVAGLLGLWLGWVLWSRYKQEAEKMRLDIASLTTTADALRAELAAAKSTLASAQAENANLISQMSSLNRNNANLRDRVAELEEELDVTQSRNRLVETELGLSYSPDTRIADDIPMEVIEQRHEADHAAIYGEDLAEETVLDVATGEALPAAAPEAETELAAPPMLETASAAPVLIPEPVLTAEPASEAAEGFRLESRVPAGSIRLDSSALDTPPAQEPAAEEPQADTLADSAPPVKTRSPKAKASAAAAAHAEGVPAAVGAATPDDLTVVEGIGPKIQMLLNQYGIYTYQELAETEVSRLKDILQAAGPQLAMHDPGTWPSQANLAANDQWEALKSIQGFLKGGKRPT